MIATPPPGTVPGPSTYAGQRLAAMTRAELDAALGRLGLDVPEKERDELAGAAHHIAEMVARLERAISRRHVRSELRGCIRRLV